MPSTDRSIIAYGPECDYIHLEESEIGGITGLLLPGTKVFLFIGVLYREGVGTGQICQISVI